MKGHAQQPVRRVPQWMWVSNIAFLQEQGLLWESWLNDGALQRLPDAATMYAEGPDALLRGWLPLEPLVGPDTRVVAFGSCFAARFAEWLAEHGYNRAFDSDSDESVLRNQLESPSVVAQQFRWAFGELESDLAFWVTPDRERFEATEEHRLALRAMLERAEVMIVTFGLAEVWYDRLSGEPIWRVPPRALQDRYAFKAASVSESLEALEAIDRIRRRHLPDLKIIYTVSPQRLTATFRGISPVVANVISKATLRAAVDEFLRSHPDELNEHYFYFPAYEIATELFRHSLFYDNVHIRDEHAALILDVFARHYTTEPVPPSGYAFPSSAEDELRETIARHETRLAEYDAAELALLARKEDETSVFAIVERLQQASDERLVVIEQLLADRRKPFVFARSVLRDLRQRRAARRENGTASQAPLLSEAARNGGAPVPLSARFPPPVLPFAGEYDARLGAFLAAALDESALLAPFEQRVQLPAEFGIGLDERVVEYPWLLAAAPVGSVLDVGAALGRAEVAANLLPRLESLTAVTGDPEVVAAQPGTSLVADLRELPYRDGSFDTVVSLSALAHVGMGEGGGPDGELAAVIGELLRVLRPGGRLLVSVPFGRSEDHGSFRQFGNRELDRLLELLPAAVELDFFRYAPGGWSRSTRDEAASVAHRPPTMTRPAADLAAAARAVACIGAKPSG